MASSRSSRSTVGSDRANNAIVHVDDEEEVTFLGETMNYSPSSSPGGAVRRRALKRRFNKGAASPTKQDHEETHHKTPVKKSKGKENFQLKEVLLKQLDLIKQQSEDIVQKDKQLRELQKENEKLRAKLRQLDVPKVWEDKAVGTSEDKLEIKDEVAEVKVEKRKCLTSDVAYFLRQGEEELERERREVEQILRDAELPGWRVNVLHPTYSMEGTENIEDEFILKRHAKMETDEKRRKRWDIQRIREQKKVLQLMARYEKGPKKTWNSPEKLTPGPENIEHVIVTEMLPVAVFGQLTPDLGEQDFALPWVKDVVVVPIKKAKK